MRNNFIFMVLVATILSSFTKNQLHSNYYQSRVEQEITLDSNKWRLTKIFNTDSFMQVSDTKAFIHFDIAGGKVNGNGSCNSFGGKVLVNGHQLNFDNIFSSKMYCHEIQAIENEFFRQLQRVTRYEIKGKKLILFNTDDVVLEFEAG
jgi:heat shock protein HslJ